MTRPLAPKGRVVSEPVQHEKCLHFNANDLPCSFNARFVALLRDGSKLPVCGTHANLLWLNGRASTAVPLAPKGGTS